MRWFICAFGSHRVKLCRKRSGQIVLFNLSRAIDEAIFGRQQILEKGEMVNYEDVDVEMIQLVLEEVNDFY